jgi:hypothetical protein
MAQGCRRRASWPRRCPQIVLGTFTNVQRFSTPETASSQVRDIQPTLTNGDQPAGPVADLTDQPLRHKALTCAAASEPVGSPHRARRRSAEQRVDRLRSCSTRSCASDRPMTRCQAHDRSRQCSARTQIPRPPSTPPPHRCHRPRCRGPQHQAVRGPVRGRGSTPPLIG